MLNELHVQVRRNGTAVAHGHCPSCFASVSIDAYADEAEALGAVIDEAWRQHVISCTKPKP